jgi:hypothetical protein
MELKTIVILILSTALAGVLGFLFSQRRVRKMFKKGGMKKKRGMMMKKKGGMKKKKKGGMKKKGGIKPEGAATGEPAAAQSVVAQYVLENGL